MKKENTATKVGRFAFLIGVILAIVLGLLPLGNYTPYATSAIVVLGLIVGFLNVTARETNQFLIATAVLVIVAGLGSGFLGAIQYVGQYLVRILVELITFVVPATIVVAIKAVYSLAEDQ